MTTPFFDNFSGEASNVDLDSHVPSSGTSWTQIDGDVSSAQVSSVSSTLINNTTSSSGALYLCDDQGSADHYTQFASTNTNIFAYVAHRATNRDNYIGIRVANAKVQIYRRAAGVLTKLGTDGSIAVGTGDVIRFESVGSTHTAYVNGVQALQVTDSTNLSVTRQGVVPRSSGTVGWLDDYEAGPLSAAVTHNLSGANSSGANQTSTGGVSQQHVLQGASVASAGTATVGAVGQTHTLAGANAQQAHTAAAAGITQQHVLQGASVSGASTSSTGPISLAQTHSLSGNPVGSSNTSTTGAMAQHHILAGASALAPNATNSGAIGQAHQLTGNTVGTGNVGTSAAVVQDHVLSGANCNQLNDSIYSTAIVLPPIGIIKSPSASLSAASYSTTLTTEIRTVRMES